jgi:hypothetical protein
MRFVSDQKKVCHWFFPELDVFCSETSSILHVIIISNIVTVFSVLHPVFRDIDHTECIHSIPVNCDGFYVPFSVSRPHLWCDLFLMYTIFPLFQNSETSCRFCDVFILVKVVKIFLKAHLDGAWLCSFYVITDVIDKESYSTRQARYMARLNTSLCQWRQLWREKSLATRRVVEPLYSIRHFEILGVLPCDHSVSWNDMNFPISHSGFQNLDYATPIVLCQLFRINRLASL